MFLQNNNLVVFSDRLLGIPYPEGLATQSLQNTPYATPLQRELTQSRKNLQQYTERT
jgi:hypothetical protein